MLALWVYNILTPCTMSLPPMEELIPAPEDICSSSRWLRNILLLLVSVATALWEQKFWKIWAVPNQKAKGV